MTKNEEIYSVYGVLSLSANLQHARIKDYSFYAIKSIIDPYINNLSFRENLWEVKASFDIKTNILSYELPTEKDIRIEVFNLQGMKRYDGSFNQTVFGEVDLSTMESGVYVLLVTSGSTRYRSKFIKN